MPTRATRGECCGLLVACCAVSRSSNSDAGRTAARIGIVFNSFRLVDVQGDQPVQPVMRELLAGLREHGYVEVRNIASTETTRMLQMSFPVTGAGRDQLLRG